MKNKKTSILISGISGSGKSSISEKLVELGFESYDIEDDEEMVKMYRKDTGEIFVDYDNADMEKVNNSKWICDTALLEKMIKRQKTETAFYCGIFSNMKDIIPFFDKFLLLQVSPEVLHGRLCNRIGTEDMGNTEEGRQRVLSWKNNWEVKMINEGAIVIKADTDIGLIVQKILQSI